MLTNVFRGRIFWLGREPLTPGARYKMKLCTGEYPVEVEKIEKVIDVNDLATASRTTSSAMPSPRWCCVRGERWRSIRSTTTCSPAGSFSSRTTTSSAAACINMDGYADQRRQAIKSTNIFLVEHRVPIEERWKTNGHRGGILWMTGLSGAGKSTRVLARAASIPKGLSRLRARRRQRPSWSAPTWAFRRAIGREHPPSSVRPPSCSPAPAFWC